MFFNAKRNLPTMWRGKWQYFSAGFHCKTEMCVYGYRGASRWFKDSAVLNIHDRLWTRVCGSPLENSSASDRVGQSSGKAACRTVNIQTNKHITALFLCSIGSCLLRRNGTSKVSDLECSCWRSYFETAASQKQMTL